MDHVEERADAVPEQPQPAPPPTADPSVPALTVPALTGAPRVTQRLHAASPVVPPRPDDAHGFAAVLGRSEFRFLWFAQVSSQLADKFLMYALLVFINQSSGSASSDSLLMMAYTLPSVFLSSAAGVYADRHDKRFLMLGTNVLRGGIVLLVPLISIFTTGFTAGASWILLIPITLAFSAVGQVFAPAEAASIPSLVGRNQIPAATSLFMTTVVLTLVAGVPLAALAIASHKLAPFYIGAGLFGIAAFFVWRIRTSLRTEQTATVQNPDLLRELREGLTILRGSPPMRMALIQLTVALVVVFTLFALGPSYMQKVLDRSPAETYIVLIPATVGIILVAAILGQRAARISRARLVAWALTGAGLALVAIGTVPFLLHTLKLTAVLIPVTIAIAAFFGCALGSLLIPAFTVLQEQTDPDSRGRIFGGIFAVINAAIAVPLLLAGVLTDLFGSTNVPLAGLGVLLVIGGILGLGKWAGRFAALDAPPFDSGGASPDAGAAAPIGDGRSGATTQ